MGEFAAECILKSLSRGENGRKDPCGQTHIMPAELVARKPSAKRATGGRFAETQAIV
jgi:hypothetical protein